jgi:NADH-quinone oxidoreductase subunit J
VKEVGKLLYTNYIFPFEVASILIIAAIVGSVMLSQKVKRGDVGKAK